MVDFGPPLTCDTLQEIHLIVSKPDFDFLQKNSEVKTCPLASKTLFCFFRKAFCKKNNVFQLTKIKLKY